MHTGASLTQLPQQLFLPALEHVLVPQHPAAITVTATSPANIAFFIACHLSLSSRTAPLAADLLWINRGRWRFITKKSHATVL